MKKDRIVFAISTTDINEVAREVLGRHLTEREMMLVEREMGKGEVIDWLSPVESIIREQIEVIRPEKLELVRTIDDLYDDDDLEDNLRYL